VATVPEWFWAKLPEFLEYVAKETPQMTKSFEEWVGFSVQKDLADLAKKAADMVQSGKLVKQEPKPWLKDALGRNRLQATIDARKQAERELGVASNFGSDLTATRTPADVAAKFPGRSWPAIAKIVAQRVAQGAGGLGVVAIHGAQAINAIKQIDPKDPDRRAKIAKIITGMVEKDGIVIAGMLLGAYINRRLTMPTDSDLISDPNAIARELEGTLAGFIGGETVQLYAGESIQQLTDKLIDSMVGKTPKHESIDKCTQHAFIDRLRDLAGYR
jgi:hypothetical protein